MKALRPEEDAYGQLLWAHYTGQRSYEIVERDDSYFDVTAGAQQYFSRPDDWPPYERQAMARATGRVLDIGCGAGRHALALQARGLDVLGIDVSPLAIQVCTLRGLRKAEIRSIDHVTRALGPFDTILLMGNNFGLFGGFTKARRLLTRFHALTTPHARLIAETRDPYRTDNPDHLAYQAENRRRGRMSGQLRLRVRYRKYVTPWFDYLLASKDELTMILDSTGWTVTDHLDGDDATYIAVLGKTHSRALHKAGKGTGKPCVHPNTDCRGVLRPPHARGKPLPRPKASSATEEEVDHGGSSIPWTRPRPSPR